MYIEYTSQGFPTRMGRLYRGTNRLDFDIAELLWAATSVGRKNLLDILRHDIFSEYEILYRASIVVANIQLGVGNRIIKSPAYMHLDPSEKSAVSYFLGLTFTKLLAQKLLNCDRLLHLDVYREQLVDDHGMTLIPGRERPDLIGLDNTGRYLVFESKGRTNRSDPGLLGRAKAQSQLVTDFAGATPYMALGVVTNFHGRNLIVDWADPKPGNAPQGISIKTSENEYLKHYYSTVYHLLRNSDTTNQGDFVVININSVDLRVGLHRSIYDNYHKDNLKVNYGQQYKLPKAIFDSLLSEVTYIGKDGILVSCGPYWNDILRKAPVKNKPRNTGKDKTQ